MIFLSLSFFPIFCDCANPSGGGDHKPRAWRGVLRLIRDLFTMKSQNISISVGKILALFLLIQRLEYPALNQSLGEKVSQITPPGTVEGSSNGGSRSI